MSDERHPLLPWVMWGLGAAFYCYGFFQRVAPSVMVADLMRDFAVGATITGMLSALYFYTYAGLQVPVGLLLDRWGSRRLLAVAAALAALGSALFATAPGLWPAYLGRLLIGAGAAVTWVGTLNLVAAWFPPKRFAMLSGLTLAMGMAGAIGGQAPLAAAVSAIGWRGTMWAAAAAALVLAAAIWLLVRDRREGGRQPEARPAEAGRGLLAGLRAVLANPQTWFVGIYGAMLTAPMLSFGGLWGVPYLMARYGLERPAAALSMSTMMVGWALGAPVAGWFTDHIGRRRLPMLVNSTTALVLMVALLYLPGLSLPVVHVLLFATGLFSGGMVLCFATAREHNPAWASGATLGVVNMTVMSTGAIFQPLIGLVLDRHWDGAMENGARAYSTDAYAAALIVLPACLLVGLLSATMVRETYCRPQR